jgi:hypothetical protein
MAILRLTTLWDFQYLERYRHSPLTPADLCVAFLPFKRKTTQRMLARPSNQDGKSTMTDIRRQDAVKMLCRLLAVLLPCVFGAGCGMDKGSSGDIPLQNIFLEAEGCLLDNPGLDDVRSLSYSFPATVDLSLMEARLEVLRGEVDLAVGTEDPPTDYFGFGRGTGTQKILVGRDSHQPMMVRPWYVRLDSSPMGIQEECEDEGDPDWRLLVRRASRIQGRVLLQQNGQVPGSMPGNILHEQVQIEVPEDAISMEVVLESLEQGDADLLVGLGGEGESLVSLNPGPGYDAVALDEEDLVPLRGQSITVLLESWQEPTEYRLDVAYTRGEVEEEPPEEEPPEEPPL